jgi:para-aminobenzoate synthetase/4-amino-4-deoxychorismate lyase
MSIRLLLQTDPALGLAPWLHFERPLRVLSATRLDDVLPVLREVEAVRQRGQWTAGYVAYEAAPAFDTALTVHPPQQFPLAWFAVFDAPRAAEEPAWPEPGPPLSLTPDADEARYVACLHAIKAAIARGETYQVNHTLRLRGPMPASPPDLLFAQLHHAQRGGYSAFLSLPEFTVCSASPELFFLQQGDRLTCRPMKGTAARGTHWPDDEARGEALRLSPKDRAENVMIVDMLRNDLGRIAPAGAVLTERLFEVQRLPTLWQMTSTVTARATAGLDEIFRALFPCASITGAPKVKTTGIIRELESSPRGLYTGAIGFAGPGVAQFNVAIRTLVLDPARGTAEYGVGSGVVWDSDPVREYQECLSKALILQPAAAPYRLLATLAWRPGEGYALLERHLARLQRAAVFVGFHLSREPIRDALRDAETQFAGTQQRVRLLVDHHGQCAIEHQPLPPPSDRIWRVALARQPVQSGNRFLHVKTTRRAVYDEAKRDFPNHDDVLLWNERGEITEGCITNLAIRRENRWVTPPLACGLLDGVMREELLARGVIVEGIVHRDEINDTTDIALFNSVRGWMQARCAPAANPA